MKTRNLAFLLVLWLLTSSFYTPNTVETNECKVVNNVFQNGEKGTYKAYYNWKSVWVAAGTVNFTVKPYKIGNTEVFHITALGKTLLTYDWFYKVRDTYETFVNQETLLPVKHLRNVNEGGFTIYNHYEFNQSKQTVNSTWASGKAEKQNKNFDISNCTHDILSAAYYMRCIDYSDMRVGDKVPMDIFLDNELYHLNVEYLGKEIIETDMGKFRCVKARPQLIQGRVFEDVNKMVIYVTDDMNRVPVMLESPLSVGSVKVMLTGYEGLRNPATAKLN